MHGLSSVTSGEAKLTKRKNVDKTDELITRIAEAEHLYRRGIIAMKVSRQYSLHLVRSETDSTI